VAEGELGTLLTPELIRRVSGVDAHVIPDPETGHPICVLRYLVGTV
jgi:ABC-type cobalamin/Fe3+-siderophores transport system ATPase subunit